MKRGPLVPRKVAEIERMVANAYERGDGYGLHLELTMAVAAFERQQGREALGLRQMVEMLTHQRELRAPEVVRDKLASVRKREAAGELPEGSTKAASLFLAKEFIEAWINEPVPELATEHERAAQKVTDKLNGAEHGGVGVRETDLRCMALAAAEIVADAHGSGHLALAEGRREVEQILELRRGQLSDWHRKWAKDVPRGPYSRWVRVPYWRNRFLAAAAKEDIPAAEYVRQFLRETATA